MAEVLYRLLPPYHTEARIEVQNYLCPIMILINKLFGNASGRCKSEDNLDAARKVALVITYSHHFYVRESREHLLNSLGKDYTIGTQAILVKTLSGRY